MQIYTLHEDQDTTWYVFGRDHGKASDVVDTNEYLIIVKDEAFLLDPGGVEIFPPVLTAVSEVTEVERIKGYLCSHQDPDIMSSLPLWLALTPNAKIYMSWLWSSFVSHFGHEFSSNFILLPDEGGTVNIGGKEFVFVPAHHCHSAGNFNFFDPVSKILFSGDIGAALIPPDYPMFVEDFSQHVQYMDKFHRRWMPSNEAKLTWVNRVRRLNPKLICPQHGAIFKGENVGKFLDWIEDLEVGNSLRYA